jgi:hypothetical protein
VATDDEPLQEGDELPGTFRYYPDEARGPWKILLSWQLQAGRAECVGVSITRESPRRQGKLVKTGPAITRTLMRDMPIGTFIAEDREALAYLTQDAIYQSSGRRRPANVPDRLVEVAAAYRMAQSLGRPTGAYVAETMSVTVGHARKLIWEARSRGLLLPTDPGVAPVRKGRRAKP